MNKSLTRRMFLAAGFLLLVDGCSDSPEEKAQQAAKMKQIDADVDKEEAYETSQKFVSDRLVSPGSAKYPAWNDSNVSITNTSSDNYSISSYVDSQNSFGGFMRSTWTLKVHKTGSQYHLDDINITQQ